MVAVNPDILIWARETAALELEEAARKLGFRDSKKHTAVEKLERLESGNSEPTVPQLYRMSKAYYQPYLVFYLDSPPADMDRGEDFRTVRQRSADSKGNAHLHLLMRDVKVAQYLIRDALEDDQVETLPFVNSASRSTRVTELAQTISEALQFEITKFREPNSCRKAFAYLRDRIERKRIFVLLLSDLGSHHTTIPVNVFRGFIFADDLAPFIVINRQDVDCAWGFTALHEVTHLWLGSSGVSGQWGRQGIERFCNQVAGEILFPIRERTEIELDTSHGIDRVDEQIGAVAQSRNLSKAMAGYSLFLAGKIDEMTWRKLNMRFDAASKMESKKTSDESRQGNGGPSYYTVRRHQLGNALIEVTKQFVDSGQLQPTKAAKVLRVKPLNVTRLLNPSAAQVTG